MNGGRLLRYGVVFCLTAICLASSQAQRSPSVPTWKAKLIDARDKQDVGRLIAAAEGHPIDGEKSSPNAYVQGLANSYLAEVYLEQGKKAEAASAAESGISLAKDALRTTGNNAEGHLLLGKLCGQIIPANLLSAISYGKCAREEIDTALRLDPQLAEGYLGRGVGNYYLPPAFGGGLEKAIEDFRKAAELAPRSSEVQLWLGIALRKQGRHTAARMHLEQALTLSPERVWIRQQLQKTPISSPK